MCRNSSYSVNFTSKLTKQNVLVCFTVDSAIFVTRVITITHVHIKLQMCHSINVLIMSV